MTAASGRCHRLESCAARDRGLALCGRRLASTDELPCGTTCRRFCAEMFSAPSSCGCFHPSRFGETSRERLSSTVERLPFFSRVQPDELACGPHALESFSMLSSLCAPVWRSVRPSVWPLPSSFRLLAYLDCFRVSDVKSNAYRRRKQLTYQLHPTPSNRLAVIAAGSRSPQQKPVIRSGGRAGNGE